MPFDIGPSLSHLCSTFISDLVCFLLCLSALVWKAQLLTGFLRLARYSTFWLGEEYLFSPLAEVELKVRNWYACLLCLEKDLSICPLFLLPLLVAAVLYE